jgi:hypothetical protein
LLQRHLAQNTGGMMQRNELFAAFESIGNNCEFGIVQEAAGYRALSLFSNVGFDSVTCITEAISCGLDGMFSEGAYEFSKPEGWPDYAVHCLRFGFIFHTGLYISEAASHSELPRRVQALQIEGKVSFGPTRRQQNLVIAHPGSARAIGVCVGDSTKRMVSRTEAL